MAKQRIRCDQCEALMINGVFCHETGCPNTRARYEPVSGEWIKTRKCFECGYTVDADNPCCSEPIEDEDDRPVGTMTAVGALSQDLQFISDSQDVAPIKEHVGESADGYDAFFVRVQDGDYSEVWGICGIVPYRTKLTTRLL